MNDNFIATINILIILHITIFYYVGLYVVFMLRIVFP